MKKFMFLQALILIAVISVSAQIDPKTIKKDDKFFENMLKRPYEVLYIDTIFLSQVILDYLSGDSYTEPQHFYTIPGPTIPESVELRDYSSDKPYGAFFPQGGRFYVQVFLPDNAMIKELRAHICDGEPDADIEINLYEWRNFTQYTSTGPEHYIVQTKLTSVKSEGSVTPYYYYLANPQFIIGPSISERVLEENAYFIEIKVPVEQTYLVIKDIRIGYD